MSIERLAGLIYVFVFVSGVLGCSSPQTPDIEGNLAGPFAVAGQPNTRNVFVLNSAFTGEYLTGSIVRFELTEKLDALQKKEHTVVPRLGSEMAFSTDGKLLAVIFQEGYSRLRLFAVSEKGVLADLGQEFATGRMLSQVQFFDPVGAGESEYFFTVVEDNVEATAKTNVLRAQLSPRVQMQKLAKFPDDLPSSNPGSYSFGFAAPAYVRDADLLVLMPQGLTGVSPELPDPIETLKGKVTISADRYDLRFVSALVLDWQKFLSSQNVAKSSAFVPLVFKNDGTPINFEKPISDTSNQGVAFRSGFFTSIALNQNNCLGENASTDKDLAPDAVLSFDLSSLGVTSFSGWDKVRDAMSKLPEKLGEKHSEKLVLEGLKVAPYSKKQGVPEIDTPEPSRVAKIMVGKLSNRCLPFWLRTELQRSSRGQEVSRFSLNFNRPSNAPIFYTLPDKGSTAFGLLSVGARMFAFSASYSYGNVRAFEVTNDLKINPLKY